VRTGADFDQKAARRHRLQPCQSGSLGKSGVFRHGRCRPRHSIAERSFVENAPDHAIAPPGDSLQNILDCQAEPETRFASFSSNRRTSGTPRTFFDPFSTPMTTMPPD
jgi:hypothetical protein